MKKWLLAVILAVFASAVPLNLAVPGTASAASEASWLNKEAVNRGLIAIRYDVKTGTKTKLMIAKQGAVYTYTLTGSGQAFPLQLGNGDYEVSLLEQADGTKYRLVKKDTVRVKLDDAQAVFLNSVQNVRWQPNGQASKLAAELTQGAKTEEAKAKAIYSYIIKKIKYDNALAASVGTEYLPNPEQTLNTGKGICYDYASLYAAMLRSQGIPAKLVMGTSAYVKQYHAWNEVYLNGEWVTVDTTVDAGKSSASAGKDFAKAADKYKMSKVY
ncbi:transglutaminase-like domain-containing protein [Gorillibacterium sp. sgz500922]|uniref:transglutaminase-like domain-containing protein n=1 Tax=Gorillibacterium sp. sgz500922 TaxID=3446694 RepID=UPI003F681486